MRFLKFWTIYLISWIIPALIIKVGYRSRGKRMKSEDQMTIKTQEREKQLMTTHTLPPEDFKKFNTKEKIQILITQWMFRLRDLGQLKNFLDQKAGFMVFDCPEVQELVSQELTRAKEEGRLEEVKTLLDLMEKSKGSDAPISITIEQYLRGRLSVLTPFRRGGHEGIND